MDMRRTVNPSFNMHLIPLRYITILYYLSDVEAGGETAFPVADNETLDFEVRKGIDFYPQDFVNKESQNDSTSRESTSLV